MQMILFFQGIMMLLIEVLCCKLFYEIFLEKRIFRQKWLGKVIDSLIILSSFTVLYFLSNELYLKHLFSFIAFAVIMIIHFRAKIIRGIFVVAIYQVFVLGIDYLGLFFIIYLFSDIKDEILGSLIGGAVIALICKILLFAIIITIRKLWHKSDYLNLLSRSEWFRFLYFPIMTLIALISLLSISGTTDQSAVNTMLLIGFWLVVTNLLVLYLIRDIFVREAKLKENHLTTERNRHQIEIYKKMYDIFEQQRMKTHEYKHQMEFIENLLSEGKTKELSEYVSSITGKLKKDLDSFDTNNIVVNAILNRKYHEAEEKDITFVLKFNDLSQIVIKEDDIVTILSNLLNNAIEALNKVDGERIMHLKITNDEEYLTIAVKNNINKQVKVVDGRYLTSKDNPHEHDIGIENVAAAVSKYGGAYVIKQEDGYFKFSILIPHKGTLIENDS